MGKIATSPAGGLKSAEQKPKPSKSVTPPSQGTGTWGQGVGKGGKIATGRGK